MPPWQFVTIPLGPVIQALYGSPETAGKMHYHKQAMAKILEYAQMHGGMLKEYNDTTCGCDYLEAFKAGKIKNDDIYVQLSLLMALSFIKIRNSIAESSCTLSIT